MELGCARLEFVGRVEDHLVGGPQELDVFVPGVELPEGAKVVDKISCGCHPTCGLIASPAADIPLQVAYFREPPGELVGSLSLFPPSLIRAYQPLGPVSASDDTHPRFSATASRCGAFTGRISRVSRVSRVLLSLPFALAGGPVRPSGPAGQRDSLRDENERLFVFSCSFVYASELNASVDVVVIDFNGEQETVFGGTRIRLIHVAFAQVQKEVGVVTVSRVAK